MDSNELNTTAALDLIRSWKDQGATVVFELTGPSDVRYRVWVRVLGADDESLAFAFLLHIGVSGPTRPFAKTEGTFVIWLEGSTVSLSDDRSSVLIARDSYRCVLKLA